MLFSDIFNPCSYVPDSETKIYLRINGMYFFKDSFIYMYNMYMRRSK